MIANAEHPDGRVVDLRAQVTTAGADLSWRLEPEQAHQGLVAVVIDGAVEGLVVAGDGALSVQPTPGNHRVEVVPLASDVRRLPNFKGAAYGRRAHLAWPRSSSEDCRAFAVYSNGGSGSVSFAAPVAVVEGAVLRSTIWQGADAGTGSGRISVAGNWSGPDTNAVYTVEIDGGRFRHDVLGAWSAWQALPAAGGESLLSYGVRVRFDDAPGAYDDGDEFAIEVGPPREWDSEELAEGTWRFAVTARDAAGNESAALDAVELEIIHLPDPVSGLTVSWDGDEVALSWTPPAGIAAVDIYSNYSLDFEALQPGIIEEWPWVSEGGSATDHVFVPAVDGLWRFYVRTRDSAGRRSESVEAVEASTTAPPTGVALTDPVVLAVVPTAGGTFRVVWMYILEGGQDVATFRVYANADAGAPVFVTPAATVNATTLGLGRFGVAEIEAATGAFGGPRWFTVRAVDGDGNETNNVDLTMGVPDATAPALAGELLGVTN